MNAQSNLLTLGTYCFQSHISVIVNWEEVFLAQADIEQLFSSFHKKLTEIVVPLKRVSKRQLKMQFKPWIKKGIRRSISIKNKLYKRYSITKNDYYFSKYKSYRNRIKHLILLSKRSFFNKYFVINRNNMKETWKGIKQIINLKTTTHLKSFMLRSGNVKITNTKAMANEFNSHFANNRNSNNDKN